MLLPIMQKITVESTDSIRNILINSISDVNCVNAQLFQNKLSLTCNIINIINFFQRNRVVHFFRMFQKFNIYFYFIN